MHAEHAQALQLTANGLMKMNPKSFSEHVWELEASGAYKLVQLNLLEDKIRFLM